MIEARPQRPPWAAELEALSIEGDAAAWLPERAVELLREIDAFAISSGRDERARLELHREIGRACASSRALLVVHAMASHAVARFGQPQLRAELGAALAEGRRAGAFALSEPEVGSDHAAVRAEAVRDGEHYVLSGTKAWLTWGASADVFVVLARAEAGPTTFLVEADRAGARTERLPATLGQRGARLATLHLERARVPASNRLGREGAGALFVANECLDLGRFLVAAGLLGAMERCLDEARREAAAREQFGVRIAAHPQVARKLARMEAHVVAARALLAECVALRAEGEPDAVRRTMIAKLLLSEWAFEVASDAVQICGARGTIESHPAARHLRDTRIASIIEGTTELLELTLGRGGVA